VTSVDVDRPVVPDVVGLPAEAATTRLVAAGFHVIVGGDASGRAVVVDQAPPPGTVAAVGGDIHIRLGRPSTLYEDRLPRVLAADPLLVSFLRGFQDVGVELYDRPDDFPVLFDPRLSSPEVARWMAGWIGLAVDGSLPNARCRAVVDAAMRRFGTRGTAAEITAVMASATGGSCEVVDPGGIDRGVSLLPGAEYTEPERPAASPVELLVILETRGGLPEDRLGTLLESMIPAWLPYRFVVTGDAAVSGREATYA
jgi:phage tail-like protein